jgi:carboxymethylenebutenolidase
MGNLNFDHIMADLTAAKDDMKGVGPIGVIGFCMGGTAAFLAACRIQGLAASVCYYGGAIGKFADEKPKCPIQMHFGEKDESIPLATVEDIKKKIPQAEVYVYPGAAHAFSNDDRPSFQKAGRDLAWSRTWEFLAKNMKK